MKILILSPLAAILKHIRQCVAPLEPSLQVQACEASLDRLPTLLAQMSPDLLIVDGSQANAGQLSFIESALQQQPALGLILVAAQPTPELLLRAMQIGVREVLPAPVSAEALQQAVGRVRARAVAMSGTPAVRRRGKVLALVSCKGGSGATFLAANLAYALAQGRPAKVALIDLNLHFGEALLYVHDGTPASTVADAVSQIQRLDGELLASSLVPVLPNFGVLAAPQSSDRVADVKPEGIEHLLNVAAAHYDYVVLDVSRNLNAIAIEAFDQADAILPVLQLTLPYIRDAKWLLSVCRSLGYGEHKLRLLVNRYQKGSEISLQDVERTLGLPVFGTVPNSYQAVAAAINHGEPIQRMAPKDPVSLALDQLASALGGSAQRQEGWLRGLFKRRAVTPISLAPSP